MPTRGSVSWNDHPGVDLDMEVMYRHNLDIAADWFGAVVADEPRFYRTPNGETPIDNGGQLQFWVGICFDVQCAILSISRGSD